ncbi:MAG: hypothetical protein ACLUUO_16310 [Sellimonas intestinalis]
MKYEAVIFDWAGTTVDYGCFAPVQAFLDAFHEYGSTRRWRRSEDRWEC